MSSSGALYHNVTSSRSTAMPYMHVGRAPAGVSPARGARRAARGAAGATSGLISRARPKSHTLALRRARGGTGRERSAAQRGAAATRPRRGEVARSVGEDEDVGALDVLVRHTARVHELERREHARRPAPRTLVPRRRAALGELAARLAVSGRSRVRRGAGIGEGGGGADRRRSEKACLTMRYRSAAARSSANTRASSVAPSTCPPPRSAPPAPHEAHRARGRARAWTTHGWRPRACMSASSWRIDRRMSRYVTAGVDPLGP